MFKKKEEPQLYAVEAFCYNCTKLSNVRLPQGSCAWNVMCSYCRTYCLMPADLKDKIIIDLGPYFCS